MTSGNGGIMTSHAIIADVHQRLVSQRRHMRHLLTNITTVEPLIWRGWRVCLRKQENFNMTPPHVAAYYVVVAGDALWKSSAWEAWLQPTKASGKRTRAAYRDATNATISHLLTLPERAPDYCEYCGNVITLANARARFCSSMCQRDGGNARRRAG